jgi:general secretion pathway protein L
MAEWLILRLSRAPDAPISWIVADAAGQPLGAEQVGALREAAPLAAGRRVAGLLRADEVLSTEVQLPARSAARAQQIVAFAIEEQLVGDVEQQHFAVERRPDKSGRTAVNVVSRALMDRYVAELNAAGIQPELLCAESALLPRNPGYTVVLLESDSLLVRNPDSALSTWAPAGDLAAAFAIAIGAEQLPAANLLVYAGAAEWPSRAADFERLRGEVGSLKVQLLADGVLGWLATQLPAAAPINLLQGTYAQRASFNTHWERWRLAAILALVLLVAHLGSQGYSLLRLHRAEKDLDTRITMLTGSIPGINSGSGPLRQRLQQQLAAALAQSDPGGLLGALKGLATALQSAPGSRVQLLDYQKGIVQVKLRASDAQSIERVNQALRAAGWDAELVAGNAAGDAYEGNIRLRARSTS